MNGKQNGTKLGSPSRSSGGAPSQEPAAHHHFKPKQGYRCAKAPKSVPKQRVKGPPVIRTLSEKENRKKR